MRVTENPAAVGGKPRRRAVPLWRSRKTIAAVAVLNVALCIAGGWWLWQSGWVLRTAEELNIRAIAESADLGFTVQEILVVGRRETSRQDLLEAVKLSRGAPILSFDLGSAKERLEALPWVREATIERMLPDTIILNLVERRPLALWQRQGRFSLIDQTGAIILDEGLDRFSELLVVVGEGAPTHASRLLEILSTQPRLMTMVKAAVWVGGRRWNVRMTGDIDVRLPEKDPAIAWARLAEYDRTHRVLERDIQVLDLRFPDRLIVRTPAAAEKPAAGRET
jgi:cell division protein FtsQ